ncbi:MAG: hypothetical protein KDD60_09020, partial [Bdellovibrionales bacterium]|nr:hypothetical protein [Bdellovibrionales bacterium]
MTTSNGQNSTPSPSNRSLVTACKKFYDSWLPINPSTLDRIKTGLVSGAYDLDQDFFFEDLKTDIGLFAYFLREARRKCQGKLKEKGSICLAPRELLGSLTREDQIQIFDTSIERITDHSMSHVSEHQAIKLRELVVSTSATEALANHNNIDGLLGFSVSSLQQIGRSLIAWNYPEVFERALQEVEDPIHLDEKLTLHLGFSPKLLVIALARDWGLSAEIRGAVGDSAALQSLQTQDPHSSERSLSVVTMLQKIYDVGATIARAHNPELYPSAEEDWKKAKRAVETLIGPDGLKAI